MNALELLTQQHRQVDELFEELASAGGKSGRKSIFGQIADALAVHSEIEEQIFYPAVKKAQTEDLLHEAVEEHLKVKQLLAELLDEDAGSADFDQKCQELKGDVQHHVKEEEGQLFPKVRKLISDEELAELGQEMDDLASDLKSGASGMKPRELVPEETDEPAPL